MSKRHEHTWDTPGRKTKELIDCCLSDGDSVGAEESDTKKEKKERLRRKVGRGANNKNLKGKRRDSGDRKKRKQKKEENFFKVSIFYKRERDKKKGLTEKRKGTKDEDYKKKGHF